MQVSFNPVILYVVKYIYIYIFISLSSCVNRLSSGKGYKVTKYKGSLYLLYFVTSMVSFNLESLDKDKSTLIDSIL